MMLCRRPLDRAPGLLIQKHNQYQEYRLGRLPPK